MDSGDLAALKKVAGGRYLPVRVLRTGHGVETIQAIDGVAGDIDVVVRVALSGEQFTAAVSQQLDRAVAAIQDMACPTIAPVLRAGTHQGSLFCVRPFFAGGSLQNRLARGPLPVGDAINVARSILTALATAGEFGITHENVCPANVMLEADGTHLRAVMTDFCLPRLCGPTTPPSEMAEGARYMSPERLGIINRPVDGRSDVYSCGAILFAALAGRPPFEELGFADLFARHLSIPVPSLRSSGIQVPRVLDEILRRMLQKEPEDRYQSMGSVLAELDMLADELNDGTTGTSIVVGGRDQRSSLTEPAHIGRVAELATVGELVQETAAGHARVVVIEAPGGGGKTTLLNELGRTAAQEGFLVIRGYAVHRTAKRPVQLLSSVAAEVAERAQRLPDFRGSLSPVIAAYADELREVAPALVGLVADITGNKPAPSAGPAPDRQVRSLHAWLSLLDVLGAPDRPCLLLLDDCQWADEFSLLVLAQWLHQRQTSSPRTACHVMIAATIRTDETTADHPLRSGEGVCRISVPPFDRNDIHCMAQSMAGPVTDALVDLVSQLSQGSPFMVGVALRALHESGALIRSPQGWSFSTERLGPLQSSAQDASVLVERIKLLRSDTVRLLAAGAVLGRRFSVTLATQLAGIGEPEALLGLKQAKEKWFIWADDDRGSCTFLHDLLRQAFLDHLEPGDVAVLHGRAAEIIQQDLNGLENGIGTAAFDLAFHFDAAAQPERALPYALIAGEAARQHSDFELAEALYRVAERGVAESDLSTRYQIAMALGNIHMLRGDYPQAGPRFELAASLADSDFDRARVEGERAELAFKEGRISGAGRSSEQALRLLGERIPRWRISFFARLMREVIVQSAHSTGMPRSWPRGNVERSALVSQLYGRLLYTWFFDHSRLALAWAQLRQLNTAERGVVRRETGHALAIHGVVVSTLFPPLWRRALRYTRRAAVVHEELGDMWGTAQAWSAQGTVLHAASRYQDGVESCTTAIELLDRTGDRWERNAAAWQRALCVYRIGDLQEAVEQAQQLHQAGIDIGDSKAEGIGLELWAKASGGAVPASLIEAARLRANAVGDVHTTASLLQAEGLRRLGAAEFAEAAMALEDAQRLLRRHRMGDVFHASLSAWLATAYRQEAERLLKSDPEARARVMTKAKQSARQASRLAYIYRNDQPHALRERACIAALEGHRRRAERLFQRSIRVATAQHAAAEREASINARDGLIRTDPTITPGNLSTATFFRSRESGSAIALATRYSTLLEAGRQLAEARTPSDIVEALEHCCVSLLHADKVVVSLDTDSTKEAYQPNGELFDGLSGERLTALTLARGRPVLIADAVDVETRQADLHVPGLRCGLFGLIHGTGGEVLGSVLAVHQHVDRLFGLEERRLLESVTALAGAVIERQRLQHDMRTRIVAAEEAERGRIARDLHDSIGQSLTSVLLELQSAEHVCPVDSDQSVVLLDRIKRSYDLTVSAITEVRRLAYELRPAVLDDHGLADALRRLASEIGHRHGLEISVFIAASCENRRFSSEVETAVYRICQEALTNVVRHSNSEICSLMLDLMGTRLRLVIEDEGVGFDTGSQGTKSLGLRGMAERAELLNGLLDLSSTPGSGTTVVFEVSSV